MEKLISVGDLFKQSFGFYKKNIKVILTVCGIGYVPVLLSYLAGFNHDMDFSSFKAVELSRMLLFLILSLIIFVVNFLVYIALFYIIQERSQPAGAPAKVADLFYLASKKTGSFAWIIFLESICILAGFILFVVPGIIFSVWFIFSTYMFVFEGKRGGAALSASRQLVKGYWWPVFGRYFLLMLLSMVISLIPILGDPINFLFIVPFCAIFGYFIYQDLKRAKSIV